MMAGGATGCALGGAASLRRNNTCPVLVVSSVIITVACGTLSSLSGDFDPQPRQWAAEVVLGLGLGLKISSSTFLSVLQSEFEDHGERFSIFLSPLLE